MNASYFLYGEEYSLEAKFIPITTVTSGKGVEVASDVFCLPIQIVNVCLIGDPQTSQDYILIDTGMPNSADSILHEANQRFGENSHLRGIILTHGHFDHVGAVVELAEQWDVPVFAHELELPYLTGQLDYPPADPTVDPGFIAKLSPTFPRHSINLGDRVQKLPADGSIPILTDWRWLHTPGHTPGHISLFRDTDQFLIAGDAFTTVKQESLYKVITQDKELNGPPAYFTTDWQAAWNSVKLLSSLHPTATVTGHGVPMFGTELTIGLEHLAQHFAETEIPKEGRYVNN